MKAETEEAVRQSRATAPNERQAALARVPSLRRCFSREERLRGQKEAGQGWEGWGSIAQGLPGGSTCCEPEPALPCLAGNGALRGGNSSSQEERSWMQV